MINHKNNYIYNLYKKNQELYSTKTTIRIFFFNYKIEF